MSASYDRERRGRAGMPIFSSGEGRVEKKGRENYFRMELKRRRIARFLSEKKNQGGVEERFL